MYVPDGCGARCSIFFVLASDLDSPSSTPEYV